MKQESRRYRLLCPIARALDHLGDRWTLLVLRDLHAGPARFSDLHAGLSGLASNLLTDRLRRLEAEGLVRRRQAEFGVTVYELTELGSSTGPLLFELAQFGSHFAPDPELRKPGNLRSIAVILQETLRRVVGPQTRLHAALIVDGETIDLLIRDGAVKVTSSDSHKADITIATTYEPLISASDGDLPFDTFVREHTEHIAGDSVLLEQFVEILRRGFEELTRRSDATAHLRTET